MSEKIIRISCSGGSLTLCFAHAVERAQKGYPIELKLEEYDSDRSMGPYPDQCGDCDEAEERAQRGFGEGRAEAGRRERTVDAVRAAVREIDADAATKAVEEAERAQKVEEEEKCCGRCGTRLQPETDPTEVEVRLFWEGYALTISSSQHELCRTCLGEARQRILLLAKGDRDVL